MILAGDLDCFFVPRSWHVDQFSHFITELIIAIFIYLFIYLFVYLFIYHTNDDLDSADPSSTQDACHTWTHWNEIALHELL